MNQIHLRRYRSLLPPSLNLYLLIISELKFCHFSRRQLPTTFRKQRWQIRMRRERNLEWSDVEPDNTHKPLSTPPHYSTPSFEPEPVDIIEIDPPAPATPDNNTHITSDKATNTVQFPLFPSFSTSNIHFQINNSELRYSSLSGLLISF